MSLLGQKRTCAAQLAMSAKGQKQTFAVQNGMSVLPPIATEKADIMQTSPDSFSPNFSYIAPSTLPGRFSTWGVLMTAKY
jgi:hypothetical protein